MVQTISRAFSYLKRLSVPFLAPSPSNRSSSFLSASNNYYHTFCRNPSSTKYVPSLLNSEFSSGIDNLNPFLFNRSYSIFAKSRILSESASAETTVSARVDSNETTVSASSSKSMASFTGHVKTKAMTKRVKHIMNILDLEAKTKAHKEREIPKLNAGDVVAIKLEVPENKRRISLIKGIVIAIRNSGINSTFRIRRILAGVGVEMVLQTYSPNIKEIKIIDRRKVRRAKLYYLRDKIAKLSTVN